MKTEQSNILEMLAEGRISADEAEQLLGAIRKTRPSLWSWLFRPLDHLSTSAALSISAGAGLLQLLVSRLHVRFDGALDSHLSQAPVIWSQALLDLALAWPLVALILWGASRLVAGQGRFIDFVGAVGLARIPLVAAGTMLGFYRSALGEFNPTSIDPTVVLIGLSTLPLVVWFVALLVNGMRTASGLRGVRLALSSTAAIIVAEVSTKLLLIN